MHAFKRAGIFKKGVNDGFFYAAVIAISFIIGILLGFFAAREFAHSANEELTLCWQTCFAEGGVSASWVGIAQTVLLYAQCTLLILLLCKTVIGFLAIPMLCILHGFLLSFSVFSFSCVLGIRHIAAIAVLFSARLLFWLPCVFRIAVVCFRESCHRFSKTGYSPTEMRFGKTPLLLLIGLILELFIIPQLMLQVIS